VNGAVTWPDGTPAVRAPILLFAEGFSLDPAAPQAQLTADAAGRYGVDGCPCGDFSGWLYVPQDGSSDPFDGGRDCWIPLETRDGNIGGAPAQPGDTVDFQVLDAPCSDIPYDPSNANNAISLLLQQQDSPDHSPDYGWAGTWQAARARIG
jgi:hypothetical protein